MLNLRGAFIAVPGREATGASGGLLVGCWGAKEDQAGPALAEGWRWGRRSGRGWGGRGAVRAIGAAKVGMTIVIVALVFAGVGVVAGAVVVAVSGVVTTVSRVIAVILVRIGGVVLSCRIGAGRSPGGAPAVAPRRSCACGCDGARGL